MLQLFAGTALATMVGTQVPTIQQPRIRVERPVQVREERPQQRLPCRLIAQSGTWSLEGTLITPDQVIPLGMVSISGKKIAAVKAVEPGPSCATRIDGIILPGLIDLHNHLTWNVHPRWKPPQQYSNRSEWRRSGENKSMLAEPQDRVVKSGLGCSANLFGEVRALVGGATSAVGGYDIQRHKPQGRCVTGLVRNLDYGSEFSDLATKGGLFDAFQAGQGRRPAIDPCAGKNADGHPIIDAAVNVLFPLGAENELDTSADNIPPLSQDRADYLACNLNSGRLRSLIVHLAEGKPTDGPSREEFGGLKDLGLLQEGLIIIHGTALQPRHFTMMKSSGVGLVWSPRSNIELYGISLNVPAALNAGVPIALAPDWSPTGSDGMLQELNYARARFDYFNSQQLTAMATSVPAKLARIDDRIGQLKAGMYADLLVIRRKHGSAYDSVVTASPADVQLVVVDGRPIYGDSELMRQLLPGKQLVQMSICGAGKAVDLSGTVAANSPWDEVKAKLQERLSDGMPAASLATMAAGCVDRTKLAPDTMTIPDLIQRPDPGPLGNRPQRP